MIATFLLTYRRRDGLVCSTTVQAYSHDGAQEAYIDQCEAQGIEHGTILRIARIA